MVGKLFHNYPVNAGITKCSILDHMLFLLYIHDFSYHAICNIAIYDDNATLYSKCDQVFESEPDLQGTADWARK